MGKRDTSEVDEQLAVLGGQLNSLNARIIDVVTEVIEHDSWVGYGIRSVAHWLTLHLGVSYSQARRIEELARRVGEFPLTTAKFRQGLLSQDQLYATIIHTPAWADVHTCELVEHATVSQIRRIVRNQFPPEPEPPSDALPGPSPGYPPGHVPTDAGPVDFGPTPTEQPGHLSPPFGLNDADQPVAEIAHQEPNADQQPESVQPGVEASSSAGTPVSIEPTDTKSTDADHTLVQDDDGTGAPGWAGADQTPNRDLDGVDGPVPADADQTPNRECDEAGAPKSAETDQTANRNGDGVDRPGWRPKIPEERVSFWWTADGRFTGSFELNAAAGILFEAALNEARDSLFHNGFHQVNWVDSLREILSRSLSAAPTDRAQRFKHYLHIGVENLPSWRHNKPSGRSHSSTKNGGSRGEDRGDHKGVPTRGCDADHDDGASLDQRSGRQAYGNNTSTVNSSTTNDSQANGSTINDGETNGSTTNDSQANGSTIDDGETNSSTTNDSQANGSTINDGETKGSTINDIWVNRSSFEAKTRDRNDTSGGRRELPVRLTNGVPIPPAVARYLSCDTQIQPIWERDGIPIGAGRSTRTISDRLRRVITIRDQGCRVPGCHAPYVEIHHITHWADGGATETNNLVSLCSKHHTMHHAGELIIEGDPDSDTIVFADRNGKPLRTGPSFQPPPPGESPTRERTVRYQHPSGERLDLSMFAPWRPKRMVPNDPNRPNRNATIPTPAISLSVLPDPPIPK